MDMDNDFYLFKGVLAARPLPLPAIIVCQHCSSISDWKLDASSQILLASDNFCLFSIDIWSKD